MPEPGLEGEPGARECFAAVTERPGCRCCSPPTGELSLHNAFKTATAAQGKNMTDVLIDFIQQYVAKHYPGGLKKGRS